MDITLHNIRMDIIENEFETDKLENIYFITNKLMESINEVR